MNPRQLNIHAFLQDREEDLLTGHGSVDAPDIGQESDLGKLDPEGRCIRHAFLQYFRTFIGIIHGVDI